MCTMLSAEDLSNTDKLWAELFHILIGKVRKTAGTLDVLDDFSHPEYAQPANPSDKDPFHSEKVTRFTRAQGDVNSRISAWVRTAKEKYPNEFEAINSSLKLTNSEGKVQKLEVPESLKTKVTDVLNTLEEQGHIENAAVQELKLKNLMVGGIGFDIEGASMLPAPFLLQATWDSKRYVKMPEKEKRKYAQSILDSLELSSEYSANHPVDDIALLSAPISLEPTLVGSKSAAGNVDSSIEIGAEPDTEIESEKGITYKIYVQKPSLVFVKPKK